MSKQSEKVKRFRKNTKKRMVESMGGKCQICGYSRCSDALEFHHIDKENKEISFNMASKNNSRISTVLKELTKCILLCSICHREVHAGISDIPVSYHKLDASIFGYFEYEGEFYKVERMKKTEPKNKTKFEVSESQLKILIQNHSLVAIGKMFGVSDNAIRKRAKNFGILQ